MSNGRGYPPECENEERGEREEVSKLTLTANDPRVNVGYSGGPTSCHICTSPSSIFRKAYTAVPLLLVAIAAWMGWELHGGGRVQTTDISWLLVGS